MCLHDPYKPLLVPLKSQQTPQGTLLDYSLLLTKVTDFVRGRHVSSRGFVYDVGSGGVTWDPNAVQGDHARCLHFYSSPEGADQLDTFGDHRVLALPTPHLWGNPTNTYENRCWHDAGCSALVCMDCSGLDVETLSLQEFQRELPMLPSAKKELTIPPDLWVRQALVQPATA